MPLLQIVFVLVVIGLVLWLLTFLPIDPTIQKIIRVLIIFVVVVWLLSFFFPSAWTWGAWIGRHR